MDEKQKPFATIYIRKPRRPLLVSTGFVLLVVVVAGLLGWRDYESLQAKLREANEVLQERTSQLHEVESRLQEAASELKEYALFWRQLNEPLGFRVWSEPNPKLEAITCIQAPEDYLLGASVYDSGYVFRYEILGRNAIINLLRDDKYKLVGKDKWSAGWTLGEDFSDDYYMHEEVYRIFPFRWSLSKEWSVNYWDWEDRLQRYCQSAGKS